MDNQLIQLNIITPEGLFLKEEIKEVYLPGELGETGILKHHLPMIIKLSSGRLEFKNSGNKKRSFFIKKGFMKVKSNTINILTDLIQSEEQLNSVEIKLKLTEINQKIAGAKTGIVKPEELDTLLKERKEWEIRKKISGGSHLK